MDWPIFIILGLICWTLDDIKKALKDINKTLKGGDNSDGD